MNKSIFKHPFFLYLLSFLLVVFTSFLKIIEYEKAELFLNATYTFFILVLIYSIFYFRIRKKKNQKDLKL